MVGWWKHPYQKNGKTPYHQPYFCIKKSWKLRSHPYFSGRYQKDVENHPVELLSNSWGFGVSLGYHLPMACGQNHCIMCIISQVMQAVTKLDPWSLEATFSPLISGHLSTIPKQGIFPGLPLVVDPSPAKVLPWSPGAMQEATAWLEVACFLLRGGISITLENPPCSK